MAAPLRINGPAANLEGARIRSLFRDVVRGQDGPAASPAPEQAESPYAERLLKLIPAEIVALYLFGIGAIPPGRVGATAAWAATCQVLGVISRAFGTRDATQHLPPQWPVVIISSVSFAIWIFTMPGPLQGFGVSPPFVGSLVMAVWTFLVPYLYKG
jgi:hypothetical protein